jgi:bla regulator protein BlaR1
MLKIILVLIISLVMLTPAEASPITPQSLGKYFTGFDGAFVIVDLEDGKAIRYKPDRCAERIPPCSTFKIFNALAGLDCGVLSGPEHKMKWDGKARWREQFNKDHTLQTAVSDSVVWYFQNVAQDVGVERMQRYIDDVGYGNRDLSGGLTTFWLGASLEISANEQVDFLRKLYLKQLPFSPKSQDTVKALIKLRETPNTVFAGKTGTEGKDGKHVLGWFVGYVVHDGHAYAFATNIKDKDGALGYRARQITEKILHDAKLMQ